MNGIYSVKLLFESTTSPDLGSEKIDTNKAKVILTEGRYHQIKRMFGCFGAKVEELQRTKMGNFSLPNDLNEGECREFTQEELLQVKENTNE